TPFAPRSNALCESGWRPRARHARGQARHARGQARHARGQARHARGLTRDETGQTPGRIGPMESVTVGDRFPVNELGASAGWRLDLAGRDGPAVISFSPADGTPTCTTQAIQFNRAVDDYQAANVALVGVSVDDEESHRCFAADEGLRFPLVSDSGGELTGRLGLTKDYGEYGMLSGRVTLLLDR